MTGGLTFVATEVTSMLTIRRLALVGTILLLTGCATVPPSKPIATFQDIAGTWEGR
jgi:hypothetical protein